MTWHSFILEGMLTVIVALLAYFFVKDEPSKAAFLSEREKRILFEALHETSASAVASVEENEHFKWKHVVAALSDWQVRIFTSKRKYWFLIIRQTWFHCISYWGIVSRSTQTIVTLLTQSAGVFCLRLIAIPSHHYQRTRLHCHDGSNYDNPGLCRCHDLVYPCRLLCRSDRSKELVRVRMLHRCLCRIPHGSSARYFHSWLDLRGMLYCSLRALPMFVINPLNYSAFILLIRNHLRRYSRSSRIVIEQLCPTS